MMVQTKQSSHMMRPENARTTSTAYWVFVSDLAFASSSLAARLSLKRAGQSRIDCQKLADSCNASLWFELVALLFPCPLSCVLVRQSEFIRSMVSSSRGAHLDMHEVSAIYLHRFGSCFASVVR